MRPVMLTPRISKKRRTRFQRACRGSKKTCCAMKWNCFHPKPRQAEGQTRVEPVTAWFPKCETGPLPSTAAVYSYRARAGAQQFPFLSLGDNCGGCPAPFFFFFLFRGNPPFLSFLLHPQQHASARGLRAPR